ncbi:SLAM family member 7-like isoform X2 [Sinocyclocheilus anshuiensis]|uniref:SLAM family member 7-like isoform X2 n=1 Tax=Sinocyclocheilus anshuiensis TaxID=1608454 RepID=UPI0007B7D49E|nr:PREDICTED: SLAM family member 7-like isoform X2 [Sinocyclocheilus anshuiensis]
MSPLKYSTTFICAVFIAIRAASEVNIVGEVGGRVSFRPTSINPPVSSIIWKHKNSIGPVVKATEWDEDDGFNTPNQRFKGITTLDKETGEITITNLNIEHSGLYTIDINSKEQEQIFYLEVLAALPKPEIKIEKIEINPNAVYLICEYSETIIWKNSAGETLKGSPQSPKGELLKVEKQGNPEVFYTCTLKNAVRESTSDPVYERDLFEESGPWWIVLIVLFLILIAAPIFVLLYKFWPRFHKIVYNNLKGKPCIGAILDRLDGNKKNEDKPCEERTAKSTNEEMKQDKDRPNETLLNEGGKESPN